MSTASNEIEKRSPAQQLVAAIRSDQFREQIRMALPPSITAEKFERVATTALLANPSVAELEPNSVFRSLIQCAQIGLLPDGKEAALVPYKGSAQLIPMVSGFRKIAAEHGWTMNGAVVREQDEFSYDLGEQTLQHRAPRPGIERGEKIAAWARARHRDGRELIEVMDAGEIAKVRAVSKATKGPWFDWEERMWEKSPARRLFAKLPLADSDLERDRIKRLLSEGELLTDPATTLYGPRIEGTEPRQLGRDGYEPAPSPAERTVPSTQEAGGDEATDAAPPTPPAPDPSEEPDVGGTGGFNAPETVAQDDTVLAAQHASQFVIPNGKHRGVALGELLDKDGGQAWLGWALAHISEPPDYVSALFAFSRVFAPELFQAELARREAS
jgi:recombination protein RecT